MLGDQNRDLRWKLDEESQKLALASKVFCLCVLLVFVFEFIVFVLIFVFVLCLCCVCLGPKGLLSLWFACVCV
jgi:hypothetical protein